MAEDVIDAYEECGRCGGWYYNHNVSHPWCQGFVRAVKMPTLLEQSQARETKLRELLWLRHGCTGLYGDDGEMQCNACGIDFKRDDPKDIEARWTERGLAALAAHSVQPDEEPPLPTKCHLHPDGDPDWQCCICAVVAWGAVERDELKALVNDQPVKEK